MAWCYDGHGQYAQRASWGKPMLDLQERYVVDANGNRVAVVIDMESWERLVERFEMLEDIAEHDAAIASGETPIPLEQALREIDEGSV
jgi:hypothetical protein